MIPRLALLALLLGTAPAAAQADPVAMARRFGANQLGLLEHCQSLGFAGEDTVAAQRDVISRLPASAEPTAEPEALGKDGTVIVPIGQTTTLASMAAGNGSSVEALCKQMAATTLQSIAAAKTGASTPPSMQMNGLQTMPVPRR